MTNLQIAYWNLQETKRHNLAYEQETYRHNVATEDVAIGTLQENTRHNKASEQISWFKETEAQRHNLATEFEINRHNVVTESETQRHNKVAEANDAIKAQASMLSASAAMKQADTQAKYVDQEILESQSRIHSNEVSNAYKEKQMSLVSAQTEWQNMQNYIYGGAAKENAHSYAVMSPSLEGFSTVVGSLGGLVKNFSSGIHTVTNNGSSYGVDLFGNLID
jgi:hypothetical protein